MEITRLYFILGLFLTDLVNLSFYQLVKYLVERSTVRRMMSPLLQTSVELLATLNGISASMEDSDESRRRLRLLRTEWLRWVSHQISPVFGAIIDEVDRGCTLLSPHQARSMNSWSLQTPGELMVLKRVLEEVRGIFAGVINELAVSAQFRVDISMFINLTDTVVSAS